MPLNNVNVDVWKVHVSADLRYALDELERPSSDRRGRLKDAQGLDGESEDNPLEGLLQIAHAFGAYAKAKLRAETRIAHEGIEKGLKALLIDSGLSEPKVRARGHELHLLLEDVRQHHPTAFNELERCFNSTIQYLESVTSLKHNTNIVEYFQEHGRAKVLEVSRYESLEGRDNAHWGMIGLVYREIIRALLLLMFGLTPKDIVSRVEEGIREAVLVASDLDPAWDAAEWVSQGPVRPRLEAVENLNNNKVLLAAVRRCARESTDNGTRSWAKMLRSKSISARKKARAENRIR